MVLSEDCIFQQVGIASSAMCPGLDAGAKDGKRHTKEDVKGKLHGLSFHWKRAMTQYLGCNQFAR